MKNDKSVVLYLIDYQSHCCDLDPLLLGTTVYKGLRVLFISFNLAIVHAIRKRCDRAKSTTRLGLRVSLYGQMLTSEIRTELASTHMNVDNVCELTSTRLRTDQRYLRTDRRRLRNDRWRNDSLAKRPTFVPQISSLR